MRRFTMLLILVSALVPAGVLAAPVSAKTLVAYERTGGFAGVHDTVRVGTHGKVTVRRRGSGHGYKLSAKRLKALERAVRDARFGSLRKRYAPAGVISDGYTETVSHAGRTVVVETGGNPPRRLRRLLERLVDLL
jgi:hypothetical protein